MVYAGIVVWNCVAPGEIMAVKHTQGEQGGGEREQCTLTRQALPQQTAPTAGADSHPTPPYYRMESCGAAGGSNNQTPRVWYQHVALRYANHYVYKVQFDLQSSSTSSTYNKQANVQLNLKAEGPHACRQMTRERHQSNHASSEMLYGSAREESLRRHFPRSS